MVYAWDVSMTVYAELVAASNFSFLRGASHPDELVIRAKDLGLKALAITDHNTLAGIVRGHKQAKEMGLQFIPGTRLVLQDGLELACLPTNRDAYGRLCQLLTTGNRRAPKGECYLWLDDVIAYGKGQIFIVLPDRHKPELCRSALLEVKHHFAENVYIGASLNFDGNDARHLAELACFSEDINAPLVAVGDVLYHARERKALQDVLTCIREKCTIHEAGFHLQANAERHLKSPHDMARLYRGYEEAVERTIEIAERCTFSLMNWHMSILMSHLPLMIHRKRP